MTDTKNNTKEQYCGQFYCHILKVSILSQAVPFNRPHVMSCKIPIHFVNSLSDISVSIGLISTGFTVNLVYGRFEDKVASRFSGGRILQRGYMWCVCVCVGRHAQG